MTLRQHVLKVIHEMPGEAYGASIRRALEREGRNAVIGVVYVTLENLESDGCIVTSERPGGPERGFRPKRVCTLTGHGLAELREATKDV